MKYEFEMNYSNRLPVMLARLRDARVVFIGFKLNHFHFT